jgi:hypothetical protein
MSALGHLQPSSPHPRQTVVSISLDGRRSAAGGDQVYVKNTTTYPFPVSSSKVRHFSKYEPFRSGRHSGGSVQ